MASDYETKKAEETKRAMTEKKETEEKIRKMSPTEQEAELKKKKDALKKTTKDPKRFGTVVSQG